MVVGNFTESPQFRELYELCRQMGAPAFTSPEQMASWIRRHFTTDAWWLLGSLNSVIDLVRDSEHFRALMPVLRRVQRFLRLASVRRRNLIGETLREMLRLNPHSLHPVESICI